MRRPPPEPMLEFPPLTKATMYCRGCWYALDGVAEDRCPECGRPFNPADRRTYRTKSRREWWSSLRRRFTAAFLVLLVFLLLAGGWLYRRYRIEKDAIAEFNAGNIYVDTAPLGPQRRNQ
ncbi:MAG: hypothetical protein QUV05_06730 [Phycisphaerae bacterium]|nr:hypothetical protein [Phycisphaerae bacterium]